MVQPQALGVVVVGGLLISAQFTTLTAPSIYVGSDGVRRTISQ